MTKRFKHSGRIYWIQFFINYFVWATLVAAGVFAVVNARWIVLFICIVTFSLTFLPYLFEEKFDIDIPVEFEILLVVFVYATLFLGEVGNFYTHFWWWDIILHVGSAVAFGIIGFMILFVLYNQGKVQMNPIWLAIFSFAFAMAIGSIWEIFEFGMDQLGIGSDEQLMGIKAGEKRTIIVKNNDIVSPAEPESVIIKPGEESKSTTGSIHYSVEAEQVEVPELPEVNEDFAKSIDPQLNSVEELRKWMEIQLLSLVTYNSKRQLETRLISKLFEENPFPIHSSIIDSIIDNTIESEQMSEEERKKYVAENIKRIDSEFRWMLVSKEIGKLENMTVEEEDIEKELLMIVQQTGKPMKEVKKFYKNKEDLNRLKSRMYDRKILEFLSENAEIEKKNMSLNEFASEFDAPY